MPSFYDTGSYNLKDILDGKFVGKVHVESPPSDAGGGRSYVMHYALVKSSPETGWAVYTKPTQAAAREFKWEGTGETLAQFLSWMNDSSRRANLRYVITTVREQDTIPG